LAGVACDPNAATRPEEAKLNVPLQNPNHHLNPTYASAAKRVLHRSTTSAARPSAPANTSTVTLRAERSIDDLAGALERELEAEQWKLVSTAVLNEQPAVRLLVLAPERELATSIAINPERALEMTQLVAVYQEGDNPEIAHVAYRPADRAATTQGIAAALERVGARPDDTPAK
jgi:hypothetical protein